jgi:2-polyprenyl-3-methyl-5-hydroxy-6-metoxy-1,4-benzoquinol methylase
MRAGADVVIADLVRESLAMCALNALDQVGAEPEAILVNWLEPNREFLDAAGDGFSIILAADVLDENKLIKPLLKLVDRLLAPEGEFWLAHPGRGAAERLANEFRQRGWRDEREECAAPWPDPLDHTWDVVTVHRFRRPAAFAGRR